MAADPRAVTLAAGVLAILGMGAVTYLARVGGLLLMAYVPPGPRVSAFLKHLSGCVLIALVVPTVWRGDAPVWAAVAATGVLARTKRRSWPSRWGWRSRRRCGPLSRAG